ncbi:MAG TPA: hypothetical protein VNP72_09545 [Longimicrobium sp.]|nr:hypothetical protein [Longimicrobium sp.]
MRYVPTGATLLVLALAGCRRGDPDLRDRRAEAAAGLGRCTQEEPSLPPKQGSSVFYVDRTETAANVTLGAHAAMLTCMTPGPMGTAITLVLPNLADSLPRPGRFRVRAPGVALAADSLGGLAWAEALIPAEGGITYRGVGGEVVLEPNADGRLVGSYLVAFERAPEGPGRGPARLVLGGAFAAPRNTLPLEAALAPASR